MRSHNPPVVAVVAGIALLLTLFSSPVSAQAEPLFHFAVDIDAGRVVVPLHGASGQGLLNGTFRDLSGDVPVPAAPGVPTTGVLFHHVVFSVQNLDTDSGWLVQTPAPQSFDIYAGQTQRFSVPVLVTAAAQFPFYRFNITALVTTEDGQQQKVGATALGYSPGIPAFNVLASAYKQLSPREIWDTELRISNGNLSPRTFTIKIVDNPCDMGVGYPTQIVIDGRKVDAVPVSLEAPAGTRVFGDLCMVTFGVAALDTPSVVKTATIQAQVQGLYVSVPFVFYAVLLLVALFLLALFVRRRKEIIEEEILGKPQKPWTIPVEQVYLKHLKQKDERAWYVVRHYLMEDEYRSALLWYAGFKNATKGSRKKERLVLSQERKYARWRKSWERAIARPVTQADRFDAKLQRKLDRQAKAAHRKELRSWCKVTAKLKEVNAKQVARAKEKFDKQAKKAEKKGLPAPILPQVEAPDFPPEPQLVALPLSAQKWSRKAEKHRRKLLRHQGNLEVKFEKADARQQARMQIKIAKLARKLDDPDFIAEHHLGAHSAK